MFTIRARFIVGILGGRFWGQQETGSGQQIGTLGVPSPASEAAPPNDGVLHRNGTDGTHSSNETADLRHRPEPKMQPARILRSWPVVQTRRLLPRAGRKYSEISYLTGVVQLGQGEQQDGAGPHTVTGTCTQTHRGTQRVTVYGTHFSMHRGIWIVFV